MIRILIVDDSITQREILRKVLEADGEFAVVGEARDGIHTVDMVKDRKPDVVLMDVNMPEMDGIEATRQVMSQCPVPVVIISGALRKPDIDHGLAALEAGAVDIVQKPKGAALLHLSTVGPDLREAIIAASQAKVRRRATPGRVVGTQPCDTATKAVPQRLAPVEVVGVCASTGGPPVLAEILSSLPESFSLPILLVQHISQPFVEGFATWLSKQSKKTVRIASDNQRLEPGVWIAPPASHIALGSRTRIRLVPQASTDIHCPSGNTLFSSLAKYSGPKAVGVQLTGMGDDGARGLLELKQAGGRTMIQNEATSMIYGMPKVAKNLGAGQYELSPGDIAVVLSELGNIKMESDT